MKLWTTYGALALASVGGFHTMRVAPPTEHEHIVQVERTATARDHHSVASAAVSHSARHAGHQRHHPPGSSNECTCLGMCQSLGPRLPEGGASLVALVPTADPVQVAAPPEVQIRRDPTAYLVPLPNAPPLA